jgi:hypothetical protein
MKKFLLFGTILMVVISCSKENLDKKEDQTFRSAVELKSAIITPNLDSIAKMNAGAFLASDLTAREIDSLAKMRVTKSGKSSTAITTAGSEYTDWSGLIHFQVFSAYSDKVSIPNVEVAVPEDYVLVGGGAEVTQTSGYGAFLTKSRPDEGLTTWYAKSKDHIESDPHVLYAYAIGMKIDGVTPDYLRSKMQVFQNTSSPMNHPNTYKTIPGNYLLIGGGAWDNYENDGGPGNMLVSSYPSSSNTWTVDGKDHRRADPSAITAYAIGIQNISFPNVGYLQVNYSQSPQYVTSGECVRSTSVPTGWALTCSGGRATYTIGRMIKTDHPYTSTTNLSTINTRDHTYADAGWSYVYALRIQKAL